MQVTLVSQNPVLFSGSLRDNIEYGLQGCSMEKVKETANKVNAHDFISKMENEYDTGTEPCLMLCFTACQALVAMEELALAVQSRVVGVCERDR